MLAPWKHVLHVPGHVLQKDLDVSFKYDGKDATKEEESIYEKSRMWALQFNEQDFL